MQHRTLGEVDVFLYYLSDCMLNSLLFLEVHRCGVKVLVTYGILNMFMPIGHLCLGLVLAGKIIPVFLASGSSARLGANR